MDSAESKDTITAKALLEYWEGISRQELLRRVLRDKDELPCFAKHTMPSIMSGSPYHRNVNVYIGRASLHRTNPEGLEDFFRDKYPYCFLLPDIEAYEKAHPEVKKKPEPEKLKKAVNYYYIDKLEDNSRNIYIERDATNNALMAGNDNKINNSEHQTV